MSSTKAGINVKQGFVQGKTCSACNEGLDGIDEKEIVGCRGDSCVRRYREICAAKCYFPSTLSKCMTTETLLQEFRAQNQKFLCPSCDVEGTSKFLMKYFIMHREYAIHQNVQTKEVQPDFATFVMNLCGKQGIEITRNDGDGVENSNLGEGSSSELFRNDEDDSLAHIGKPVRLFCPLDNIHHVGRVIDRRPAMQGVGEYLIRFRSQVNGRKIAVHQWINFDEHILMIGDSIVWAKSDDGSDTYKLGQVMLRSKLELAIFAFSKSDKCGSKSLVAYFGEERMQSVELNNETMRFPSRGNLESKHIQCQDETMNKAIAMAYTEAEEFRRLRNWHLTRIISNSVDVSIDVEKFITKRPKISVRSHNLEELE